MLKFVSCAVLLVLALSIRIAAQSPSPTPTPPQQDEDVVRINTNLIQLDVTVTDADGKPVRDLTPEDFEILENGNLQKITNFSFITLASAGSSDPAPKTSKTDTRLPTVPPARLTSVQVRRTIALVVDDGQMSSESIAYTRQAFRKFVDTVIQPGDLVAIIRSASGIGTRQQSTSDKRLLDAAFDRSRRAEFQAEYEGHVI